MNNAEIIKDLLIIGQVLVATIYLIGSLLTNTTMRGE